MWTHESAYCVTTGGQHVLVYLRQKQKQKQTAGLQKKDPCSHKRRSGNRKCLVPDGSPAKGVPISRMRVIRAVSICTFLHSKCQKQLPQPGRPLLPPGPLSVCLFVRSNETQKLVSSFPNSRKPKPGQQRRPVIGQPRGTRRLISRMIGFPRRFLWGPGA